MATYSFQNKKELENIVNQNDDTYIEEPDELFFIPLVKKKTINMVLGQSGCGKSNVLLRMALLFSRTNSVLYINCDPSQNEYLTINLAKALQLYDRNDKYNFTYYSSDNVDGSIDWDSLSQEYKKVDLVFIDHIENIIHGGKDGVDSDPTWFEFGRKLRDCWFTESAIYLAWQVATGKGKNEIPTREWAAYSMDMIRMANTAIALVKCDTCEEIDSQTIIYPVVEHDRPIESCAIYEYNEPFIFVAKEEVNQIFQRCGRLEDDNAKTNERDD